MCDAKPRNKFNWSEVTYENPLKIPIINGDRTKAMKALRASYTWASRHGTQMFGVTKDGCMYIYRVKDDASTNTTRT